MKKSHSYDLLIIGAGVHGLSTAYYAAKAGIKRIGLIEQFEIGHSFGSSHGYSRTTRCVYHHPDYVKLMQTIHSEVWPALEKEFQTQFFYPNRGCFFGRGLSFQNYIDAVKLSKAKVEILTPSEGRKFFPQLTFHDVDAVIYDKSAGVIAAAEYIASMTRKCLQLGVEIMENTVVSSIETDHELLKIKTQHGDLSTQRAVITAGAWVDRLVPTLRDRLTVTRQTVCYLKLKQDETLSKIGHFPNWSYDGGEVNQVFYGLPQFRREGIKIAQHITSGEGIDPDNNIPEEDPNQINTVVEFAKKHFAVPVEKILASESCLYTNTTDENFIIDLHPLDRRIVIGSICSGHGFKFAPLMGEILVQLVLNGSAQDEIESIRQKHFLLNL